MRTTPTPTLDELTHGGKFGLQIVMCGDHSSGEIWCEPNVVRWRYSAATTRPAFSPQNPWRRRDTVYTDEDGSPVLVIRQVGLMPLTFEMVEDGSAVGKIVLRSALRNRYRIELGSDRCWDFRMPLFSSEFYGVSTSGARVFARVGAHLTRWLVLVECPSTSARLLFALAFIHNRAWNHG